MRSLLGLIIEAFVLISLTNADQLLMCYFDCDTRADLCRNDYRITRYVDWIACNKKRSVCLTNCRNACWSRCFANLKPCFKNKRYRETSACMRREKLKCAKVCASKRQRTIYIV